MRHLGGPFWFASRETFLNPGLYYFRKKVQRVLALPRRQSEPELIEFPEQTVVIAKDQPQYRPLPAYRYPNDPGGKIIFCWKLGWRNRLTVLLTGKLWHSVLTFNQPLQPQLLMVHKPSMPRQGEDQVN